MSSFVTDFLGHGMVTADNLPILIALGGLLYVLAFKAISGGWRRHGQAGHPEPR